VLKRQASAVGLTELEIDTVVDYLCSISSRREVYFLWRPVLTDPLGSRTIWTASPQTSGVSQTREESVMSVLSLRLPDSLHDKVRELAKREAISLNQFIAMAVAEKMSALITNEYLDARASRGTRKAFDAVLKRVSDVPASIGDDLVEPTGPRRRVSRRVRRWRARARTEVRAYVLLPIVPSCHRAIVIVTVASSRVTPAAAPGTRSPLSHRRCVRASDRGRARPVCRQIAGRFAPATHEQRSPVCR
jgi:HicB family